MSFMLFFLSPEYKKYIIVSRARQKKKMLADFNKLLRMNLSVCHSNNQSYFCPPLLL